jgi:hypothetical protein
LDIPFNVGTSCERAAPLAEKNAAARHHVLRSMISLHNEYRVQLLLQVGPGEKNFIVQNDIVEYKYDCASKKDIFNVRETRTRGKFCS